MSDIPGPQIIFLSGIGTEVHQFFCTELRCVQHTVESAVLLQVIVVVAGDIALALCPEISLGSRIGDQREKLGCIRIEAQGCLQSLLHGLSGLAFVAHHVAGMDHEARLSGIGHVGVDQFFCAALLDIQKNLVVIAFKTGNDQMASGLLHGLHGLQVDVDSGVAEPSEAFVQTFLYKQIADLQHPFFVGGKGIVLNNDLMDLREEAGDIAELTYHVFGRAESVLMAVQGLGIDTEVAVSRASAAGKNLNGRIGGCREDIVPDIQIMLDKGSRHGDLVHIFYMRGIGITEDLPVFPVGDPEDLLQILSLINSPGRIPDDVVILMSGYKVDGFVHLNGLHIRGGRMGPHQHDPGFRIFFLQGSAEGHVAANGGSGCVQDKKPGFCSLGFHSLHGLLFGQLLGRGINKGNPEAVLFYHGRRIDQPEGIVKHTAVADGGASGFS